MKKHTRGNGATVLILLLSISVDIEAWTPQKNRITSGATMRTRGGGIFGNQPDEKWEYYDDESNDVEDTALNSDDEYEYYEKDPDFGRAHDIKGEFMSDSVEAKETERGEEQESEVDEDDGNETDDFLLSTPIPQKEKENKASPSKPWFSRNKSITNTELTPEGVELETITVQAKTKTKQSRWTTPKVESKPRKQFKLKSERRKFSSKAIASCSSSGASFIYPTVNKLSSMVRDVSSASARVRFRGRNIIKHGFTSISNMTFIIIQPIMLFIQAIINSATTYIHKWITVIIALIRQSVDVLWYGPVDGVTTTGISRAGGLSGLFTTSSLIIIVSSVLVIGTAFLVVQEVCSEETGNVLSKAFKRLRRQEANNVSADYDRDDEFYDREYSEPSPEDELRFLDSFDAANPTSRKRISKKISKKRSLWPFNTSKKPSPRQEKRQHQRSIKSIQKWWKQRPSSSVQIIEPSHVQNQQQPSLSQQISTLKNELAQSEQERAVLHSDVMRLQHRLQKAHHDAKAIVFKNQWLEKQQS